MIACLERSRLGTAAICCSLLAAQLVCIAQNLDSPPATGSVQTQAALPEPDYKLTVQPIATLMRSAAALPAGSKVRVQGIVLEQRLGEYIIVSDATGTLFAETPQTTRVKVNQRVDLWGEPVWDGARVYLRNATFRQITSATGQSEYIGPKPAELPLLTNAWQVRDLPPERAAWNYPVRLRGVVTVCTPHRAGFTMQDEVSGIYVAMRKGQPHFKTGDLVLVEGVSDPGEFSPVVIATNVTVLGTAPLPPARPVTLFQLATGQEGSQWIEVRGVVRAVSFSNDLAQLEVGDPTGTLQVNVPTGVHPTNLLDAIVRIRGAAGSLFNERRQLIGVRIWVPSLDYIEIEEPGITDPFTLPVQPISTLFQYRPRLSLQRRLAVSGVVTFIMPSRSFFIQDGSGGVEVFTTQADPLKPGDRVTVAGYPAFADYGTVLRGAVYRQYGSGPMPQPRKLDAEQPLKPELHAQWVQTEGRLVDSRQVGGDTVLTLQLGSRVFEAKLMAPANDYRPPQGSTIELTGVYKVLADEGRTPVAFQLLVPPGQDIRVLSKPSWWTFERALVVVSGIAIVGLGALCWVALLRRQVQKQTRQLHEQYERERALEQRYRAIFEGAKEIILAHDIDGRITTINPAGLELLGYGAEEVGGKTIEQIVAPECQDDLKQMREVALAQGEAPARELELVTKSGRRRYVEMYVRATFKDNKPVGLHCIARDITERKQTEAALRESEAMYHSLVEHLPAGVFRKDAEGRYVYVNPWFCKLKGVKPEFYLGKTPQEVAAIELAQGEIPADQISKLAAQGEDHHWQIMRTGKQIELEERSKGPDGRERHFYVVKSPIFDSRGNVVGSQGVMFEITDRKQAEAALRESEALYHSLVEQLPVNVYRKDSYGRFVYVNSRFCKFYGFEPGQVLGKTVREIFPIEQAERFTKDDQTVLQTGEPIEHEEEYTGPDGKVKYLHVMKVPVLGSDGTVIGIQGISVDITARKQAEAAAAEASSLLDTLLENIPDTIYFKDRQSRFVRFSKAFLKLFNVSDPEVIRGKTDFDFFTEEHARPAFEDEQEIIRTGKPIIGKLEKETHPDGRVTWCLTTKMPWRDKDGNIIGTFGISRDVTELKRVQDELAYERELLDTLLNNVPDSIYFKDRQSRFVRFSRRFLELFKVSDPEVIRGKTDFDFFTEEHARQAFEDEQEIIRTGKPIIGKLEKETHPDGRITWCLTTKMPWYDKDGNIIGTFGISKDATELKRAQDQLAYERELLRALLDNVPDSIYFKDTESRFVRVSRSKLLKALEHSPKLKARLAQQGVQLDGEVPSTDVLVGLSDFDILSEEDARAAFEDEQQIIRTGQPIIGKIEKQTRKDGTTYWSLTTKMPWRDKDGKIIGTFGISRDITALKEAQAEVERTHRRLVDMSRMAGMSAVASEVLHNVGNVLTSVNTSCSIAIEYLQQCDLSKLARVSELLKENAGRLDEFLTTDPKGRFIPDYLSALAQTFTETKTAAMSELGRLRGYIDHIKQIVAMQQSYAKVAGLEEEVEVTQLVEDALRINEAALDRHSITINREIESVPTILVDKHKVLQILVNLIRNAKYALSDSGRPDRTLTLRVRRNGGDKIQIQVIDNGVGIPPENLTRIFSHGFTTRGDGHGFGLHSGALLAKELGGELTAHSDGVGKGATFTLVLPLKPPQRK